jgi:hypothetical protein
MKPIVLKKGPALLFVESRNIPKAWQEIDRQLKKEDCEIVELTTISPGISFSILNGSTESLKSMGRALEKNLEPDLIQVHQFESIDNRVWDAFFGLSKTRVEKGLMIAESTISIDCICMAQRLLEECGVLPIEIRTSRGQGGVATYFGSVPEHLKKDPNLVIREYGERVSYSHIDSPHSELLKFFNI